MRKMLSVLCAIAIIACSFMAISMTASAVASPGGKPLFNVAVQSYSAGKSQTGSYTVKGDTIVLTASDSSLPFTGWVIDGKYEIVSGSLNSKELVIRPLSDVNVEESYDVQGSQGFGKSDTSGKAPQTGNNALALVSLVAVGAFSVMLFSKKRIAE